MFKHLKVLKSEGFNCVDRQCHVTIKHLSTAVLGVYFELLTSAFKKSHKHKHYLLLGYSLDNIPLSALDKAWKTASITSLTASCIVNFLFTSNQDLSIPYSGVCSLDHGTGPKFHLKMASVSFCYGSKGTGRYSRICARALPRVSCEHILHKLHGSLSRIISKVGTTAFRLSNPLTHASIP
jgi:hypothetical protein